jgi:phosphate starvation-inducible PhoH-like protein
LKTRPLELVLSPVDNQRLANLCGAMDENLRQIETALDVTIARRGEKFTLRGAQAARAAEVLQKFYGEAKRSLTVDDIQLGLIEVRSRGNAKGDAPLLTRRADLHGRTPRQRQYIQNILEHDITFAIGPAGTGKTYLAVACAVDALERDAVKRIVLVRPAVEAGERLGSRAILPRRSTPTCALFTTPSTISSASTGPASSSSAERSSSRRSPTCAGAR